MKKRKKLLKRERGRKKMEKENNQSEKSQDKLNLNVEEKR
jgi:hypothetical protein